MKKRLFFSIPLSNDISDQLVKAVKQIKIDQEKSEKVRWLSPENWHVTLLFMGDVQDTLVPEILEAVEEVFRLLKPFSLKFKEIVFAPASDNARMIWAEYEKNESYNVLSRSTYQKLKHFILEDTGNDSKDIIPHVTLARLKSQASSNNRPVLSGLVQPQIHDLKIDTIELMESRLTLEGPVYTRLYEFKISAL